ncbi:Bax inhibitor-1/YccA family protein [Williamwhitmania taraxaci]|uniref:Uncharacterized membrane protein, YccA/Bax inhibitor family n=1 Tax=Williamwhitmania taraxaci TaxID=1640674 RepID=A0A1G6LCJ4_9BACT|nr:Bax inhibitor-1/YccA family protein [Williamwhitmania taraxaci]SDC40934.1 Uncharacterized membrane protein, YccA/Bax inhibitor family [Williamwhitmania taraxaci]
MGLFDKTSNPTMREGLYASTSRDFAGTEVMTINGTINKTFLMLLLVVLGGSYTWKVFSETVNQGAVMPWMIGGAIGGLIAALIIIFRPKSAPIVAPIYAILEGLFLGAISAFFNAMYPGIAIQAVALTIGTLLIMLFLYRTGIIKVTQKFMAGVMAATGAVALFYIITMIMGMFGADTSFMSGNSNLSIGISAVVVGIAALNLVLDFHFIVEGSKSGAPKYMEWYGAFSLMVTLIWLYLELLRLLSKISSRN